MTGCDSNNAFYAHGKNSVYDKISRVLHLWDLIIDIVNELPLSDSVSKVMKTLWGYMGTTKANLLEPRQLNGKAWKRIQRFDCLDDDTLDHYCERASYLLYIQLHPEVYNHPSSIGHGWMLVNGLCRPIRNRLCTLPNNVKQPVVDIDCFSLPSDGESDEKLDDMLLE